jgi:hypothetical protein
LVDVQESLDVAVDAHNIVVEETCPPATSLVVEGRLSLFAKRSVFHEISR